jgi:hypothetical protein
MARPRKPDLEVIEDPNGHRCYPCQRTLAEPSFATDRSKASGRKSICIGCDREKSREYYRDRQRGRVF